MVRRYFLGRLSKIVAFIALSSCACASQASAQRSPPDDDWTLCMRYDTLTASRVGYCSSALSRSDLSNFHRSLLISSRGGAYADLGQYAKAVSDFTQTIRLDPRGAEDPLVRRGIAYEGQKDFHRALKDYDAAIRDHRLDPANRTNGSQDVDAEEHALRGRVLLRLGRPRQAYAEFVIAIKKSPSPDLGIREYDGGVGADVAALKAMAKANIKQ